MKVFVINLKKSPERLEAMKKQLDKLDIPFEIFTAVDGGSLEPEYLHKTFLASQVTRGRFGEKRGVGEIGCATSHFNIYKTIVEQNTELSLILEDDIKLTDDFLKVYHFIEANKKKVFSKFDYIQLGFCTHEGNWVTESRQSRWRNIKIDQQLIIAPPAAFYWSAIGYFVTNRGAKILFELGNPVRMVSDYLLAVAPKYGLRSGILNHPVIQTSEHNESSNIEHTSLHAPIDKLKRYQNSPSANTIKKFSKIRLYYFIRNRFPGIHRFIGKYVYEKWFLIEHGFK